jgi:hypothetical protein
MKPETQPHILLYREDESAYPFEMWMKNKYYRYLHQTVIRLFALFLIYTLIKILWAGLDHSISPIGPIILSLAISCILVLSEDIEGSNIRAITPFSIYNNGIMVRRSILERVIGRKRFIPVDDIKEVRILRHTTWQRAGVRGKIIKWTKAPIKISIILNKGRRYDSGRKNNVEVYKMRNVMREHWNVPVVDEGKGIGVVKPNPTP